MRILYGASVTILPVSTKLGLFLMYFTHTEKGPRRHYIVFSQGNKYTVYDISTRAPVIDSTMMPP